MEEERVSSSEEEKNGMTDDIAVDEITDDLLKLLLTKRGFIDIWSDGVEKALNEAAINSTDEKNLVLFNPTKTPSIRQDPFVVLIDELVRAVNIAIETFLSSPDIPLCHNEPERNRDAAIIYTTKVQVERLVDEQYIDPGRCEPSIRRLSQLTKLFTNRISSPFQIANTYMFAMTLCNLLDIIETQCSKLLIAQGIPSFSRSVNNFNVLIVGELEKLNVTVPCSKSKNDAKRRSGAARAEYDQKLKLLQKKRKPFVAKQNSSYLLPQKLLEDRQRIRRTRSRQVINVPNQQKIMTFNSSGHELSTAMHNKWEKLLGAEQVFRSSIKQGVSDEASIRMAQQISKEVVRNLKSAGLAVISTGECKRS